MKRSAVVVALAGLLFAMLGILAPASSNAASSDSASSSVVCKLKGFRKVVCPTAKLRGPRGPAGARGPAGPAGPAGPGGSAGPTGVSPFRFLATGDKDNTTITTFTGAVAESSCSNGGGFLGNARLRGTAGAQNGVASIVDLNFGTFTPSTGTTNPTPDFDAGDTISLTTAIGLSGQQYGLVYGSEGGTQTSTAHYMAWDASGTFASSFDCGIIGTVQISA